ncbi:MAG: hypothetical protein A4S16_10175 [Proteobacteria bacterium SG_bin6]|nr:MAG: hypothetical protein A4S16_10175 [Proteobacteria bacterium SG_bin6]
MRPVAIDDGDIRVEVDPARGGGITRFDWRGHPILRPASGIGVLDLACFVLVPFSNRIADGLFQAEGRVHRLAPNHPDQRHPLHGMGWLAAWTVAESKPCRMVLRHERPSGDWPWHYATEQRLSIEDGTLRHALQVTNRSPTPMFAGLGFHPYFPRNDATLYAGRHRGEWQVDPEGLPIALATADEPRDWWEGAPLASRRVDTCYTDRDGPLKISWPDRGIAVELVPDAHLAFTHVFVPDGADYACIEPVSHSTDAINRRDDPNRGGRWIASGETFAVELRYRPHEIG